MNLAEFAEEACICIDNLRTYNQMPDGRTTKAVVEYFTKKDNPREKHIIKNWLLQEGRKYHIEDKEIFMALGDYLSYQSHIGKYTYHNGRMRLRYELYSAYNLIFKGKEQVIRALGLFLTGASALNDLHNPVIVQSNKKLKAYGLWESFYSTLEGHCLPISRSDADFMSASYHKQRIMIGILPNHFYMEITENNGLHAMFTNDAVVANGEYLRYWSATSGMCGKQVSRGLCHFRIAYIMELTRMGNAELSNMLYIDKTLISKWKNGKRRLRCYDDMLHKFTAALYYANERNKRIIRSIVLAYFNLQPSCEEPDILLCFRKWLTYREEYAKYADSGKPYSVQYARYLTYMGRQGLKDAVKTLLHYVGQAAGPVRMYITCFETMEWLYSLDDLLLRCLSSCAQISVDLAINADFAVGELVEYLLRSPGNEVHGKVIVNLIVSGKITLQLFHSNKPSKRKIIFAVPEEAALGVSRESGLPDEILVQGYYDRLSVNELLRTAVLPAESVKAGFGGYPADGMETLIINDIGILGLLEKDDLIRIFHLTSYEAEHAYSQYPSAFIKKDQKVKFFISGEEIKDAIRSRAFLYKPLSVILQREVYISGHIMKLYIKKAMRLAKEAVNYDIHILSEKGIDIFGRCIIDENELILWNENGIRMLHDKQLLKLAKSIFEEQISPFIEKDNAREHNFNMLSGYLSL